MHTISSIQVISCILVSVAVISDSARILAVYPAPSISHQIVFRPVMLELSKRGHEVVVITPDPMFPKGKAPVNYTEIDVHDISYGIWRQYLKVSTGKAEDLVYQLKTVVEQILVIFKKQLETPEVQNVLRDKQKFDLLFIEACARPALILSHLLKTPTIQFSSFGAFPGNLESVGAPTNPFLYPLPLRQKVFNLTIREKLSEYYNHVSIEKIFLDSEKLEYEELKRMFGSDIPTISEMKKNVDLIFFNVHPLWDFNRPVPPNVIYLGGLHQNPLKPLPKDLQSLLDSSMNGIIYMSLGTNVKPSTLPREKVRIFLKVFSALPYDILWKWDQDELEGRPNNVKIMKWFPQSDLLQHPKIKLFITQGGLQSTDEAITAGVPLVGMPMLGDQWYNTELYVHHGIGVKLDIETLTEDELRNAINTVLSNGSYRENIVKLRTVMRDQPQTALERAIWWTEHVLRHGGARHLRSSAAGISWTDYLELELVLTLAIAVVLSLVLMIILLKFAVRLIRQTLFDTKEKKH